MTSAQHEPRLITVSIYGDSAPSSRVRVNDWLKHTGIAAASFNYLGRNNMRPMTVIQHPVAVARSELAARAAFRRVRGPLLLSREASPFSRGGLEERLLKNSERGVYDFDDALFEDAVGLRRIYGKDTKCHRSVQAADVVIAGNDYLAEWAAARAADVRVIPSCIEPAEYTAKTSWDIGEHPVIVWLGSPSTEKYLESIAASLRRLHAATGARVRLISGPRQSESPALEGLVDRHLWSLDTMPGLLAGSDVAIAPLDDTPYSRGKCAYKLLQYAASGLPIVGSPVGANYLALQRFSGLAVEAKEDWFEALTQVLAEPHEQRRGRGLAGINAVRNHYSFEAWAPSWLKATGLL